MSLWNLTKKKEERMLYYGTPEYNEKYHHVKKAEEAPKYKEPTILEAQSKRVGHHFASSKRTSGMKIRWGVKL